MNTQASGLQRFSTRVLPERQRLEVWHDVFGREVARLDITPLGEDAPYCDIVFREFGGVSLAQGQVSAIACERTRELLSDGNDAIILMVPLQGTISLEQRGTEITAQVGDVLVRRSDEAGKTRSIAGCYMTLTLPASALETRVVGIDRLTMAVLPRGSDGVGLLTFYARMLLKEDSAGIGMNDLIKRQLADIAAVAIGAVKDAWHMAEQGGLKAARLRMIHATIRARASEDVFSLAALAREMGISPGYVRTLLAAEGTSFSALVLERRLQVAHGMLTDPGAAHRTISAIALEAGFGDVSYFNRAFKRRFGSTPGDIRAMSRMH